MNNSNIVLQSHQDVIAFLQQCVDKAVLVDKRESTSSLLDGLDPIDFALDVCWLLTFFGFWAASLDIILFLLRYPSFRWD